MISLLIASVSRVWRERFLLSQFILRDFAGRYKGTHFGLLWSIILPIIMLATYTFVFGFVFRASWTSAQEGRIFFATALFASLIPFNFFSETLMSSAHLLSSHTNLVKKVVFPLEILPMSRVVSAMLHAGISFLILLIFLWSQDLISINLLYVPFVLFPFFIFTLGISFIVSATTVFIRDIGHILGTIVSLLMFLSPIFYPSSAIPAPIRSYVLLNPIALMVEQMRAVSVFHQEPHWNSIFILWGYGLIFFFIGYYVFLKLKSSFADVM